MASSIHVFATVPIIIIQCCKELHLVPFAPTLSFSSVIATSKWTPFHLLRAVAPTSALPTLLLLRYQSSNSNHLSSWMELYRASHSIEIAHTLYLVHVFALPSRMTIEC